MLNCRKKELERLWMIVHFREHFQRTDIGDIDVVYTWVIAFQL